MLRLDAEDLEVFREEILPCTKLAFTRLRWDIDLTIREIGSSLGRGAMVIEATQSGSLEYLDQQRAAAQAEKGQPLRRSLSIRARNSTSFGQCDAPGARVLTGNEITEDLLKVSKRLRMELGTETPAQSEYTRPSTPEQTSTPTGEKLATEKTGTVAEVKGDTNAAEAQRRCLQATFG